MFEKVEFTSTSSPLSDKLEAHHGHASMMYVRDANSTPKNKFLLEVLVMYMVRVCDIPKPLIFHNIANMESTLSFEYNTVNYECTLEKYNPLSKDQFLTAITKIQESVPVVMTGDMSFMEALMLGRLVLYDWPGHKSLISGAFEYLSEAPEVVWDSYYTYYTLAKTLSSTSLVNTYRYLSRISNIINLKTALEHQRMMVHALRGINMMKSLGNAIQRKLGSQ